MSLNIAIRFQQIVGAGLERMRNDLQMTQATMAEAMGMSAANLSRLESGHGDLGVERLIHTCRTVDVNPRQFLDLILNVTQELEEQGATILFLRAQEELRKVGFVEMARYNLRRIMKQGKGSPPDLNPMFARNWKT